MNKKDYHCRLYKCKYRAERQYNTTGDCRYVNFTGQTKLGSMTPEQRKAYMNREIRCPCYEPKTNKKEGKTNVSSEA